MDSNRSSIGNNAIVRHIKSVAIHENYHSYTFNNDIAIIEMDEPVSVNGIVRTACLPEDSKLFLILITHTHTHFFLLVRKYRNCEKF